MSQTVRRLTVKDYMNQGYSEAQAKRHVKWDSERERKSVAAEIGVQLRKSRRTPATDTKR